MATEQDKLTPKTGITLDRALAVVDKINTISGKVFSFLFLALMIVVLIEVVARYVFHRPTSWVFETSLYIFAAMVALGAGFAFLNKDFVAVDVAYNKFSPRARAIIDVATFFFIVLFVSILLWKGWDMTAKSIRSGEHTQSQWAPYVWPLLITVPIGCCLLLVQIIAKCIRDWRIALGKERP